jgi:hypothetical protein
MYPDVHKRRKWVQPKHNRQKSFGGTRGGKGLATQGAI